ncbi:MAG TPA: YCF48-related protein [Caldilinea sp.]|nr:YCF48-related protein [Caldilinea sp.]
MPRLDGFRSSAGRWAPLGLIPSMLLIVCLFTFGWSALPAQAEGIIIQVPDDYGTIQAAIDAARDGDEIRVVSDSYDERLVITKSIQLTGGWNISFTEQTKIISTVDAGQNGRALTVYADSIAPSVVISNFRFVNGDATGLGGVVAPTLPATPAPIATGAQGIDVESAATRIAELRAILSNPAVQGGLPNAPAALEEALTRIDGLTAEAQAELAALTLVQPASAASPPADEIDCGGGAFVRGAALHLMTVLLSDNVASRTGSGAGGAICVVNAPADGLILEHVSISRSVASERADGFGGGLYFDGSAAPVARSLQMNDIVMRSNRASLLGKGYGGGAFVTGAPAAGLQLAVFANNVATLNGLLGRGGGLYLIDSSDVHVEVGIFELNTAALTQFPTDPLEWVIAEGGGLYANHAPRLWISNAEDQPDLRSIFVGNIAAFNGLGHGGGIFGENIDGIRIEQSDFLSNWGMVYTGEQGDLAGGGGVHLKAAEDVRVVGNSFRNNVVGVFNLTQLELFGGALDLSSTNNVAIIDNSFESNAGGATSAGGHTHGGAAAIGYTDVITISDNTFVDNTADLGLAGGLGGALYLQLTNDTLIQANTFVRNRGGAGAGIGGALVVEGGSVGVSNSLMAHGASGNLNTRVTVSGNLFRDNRAATNLDGEQALLGGAVAINSTNGLTVRNNVMSGNAAAVGGAMALFGWNDQQTPHDIVLDTQIINNTLVNNVGNNGLYLEMWKTPITLTNNIVISHTVGIFANTNQASGGMTAEVSYTVYNNNATDSQAAPESTLIERNAITSPVEFVNFWGGDYHLQVTSPARNGGDPAGAPLAPPIDIEGTPRPFGPRVDIGAYEWHGPQMFLPQIDKNACSAGRAAGWAVGIARADGALLLHTADSGATWTTQGTASDRQRILNGVSAVDADHAWVTGDEGTILHTHDGGRTWQRQSPPPELPAGYSVNFVAAANRDVAWATAVPPVKNGLPSYILHTADGGATWRVQYAATIAPGFLNWIAAANEKVAYATGGVTEGVGESAVSLEDGRIFRTMDGGAHWEQTPNPGRPVISIHPVSEYEAWAVGKESSILRTYDAGATWQDLSIGMGMDINAVFTFDGREVWLVGDEAFINHTANGQAAPNAVVWENQQPSDDMEGNPWFMDVSFVTSQEGWITGIATRGVQDGVILHTTDGGATWRVQPHPAQGDLWHLSMVCGR